MGISRDSYSHVFSRSGTRAADHASDIYVTAYVSGLDPAHFLREQTKSPPDLVSEPDLRLGWTRLRSRDPLSGHLDRI